MRLTDTQLKERVAKFKSTVAADLYSAGDIVDLPALAANMETYAAELDALNCLIRSGQFDSQLGEVLLTLPRVYAVLCSLLSVNSSIELEDGRRLPAPSSPPRDPSTIQMVTDVLLELGLSELLKGVSDVRPMFLVVQVASDVPRRRFRAEGRIAQRVKTLINKSLAILNEDAQHEYALGSTSVLPSLARRIVEYVITVDGKPRIALATTFQAHSGGRQSREMSTLYPSVQTALSSSGINLILIADGQGMRALSERVLLELIRVVPYTMSLAQAQGGEFTQALASLADEQPETSLDTPAVHKLIQSAINQGSRASATTLPIAESTARLSLASFASTNKHLNLVLSGDGSTLTWAREKLVAQLRSLRTNYCRIEAETAFAELIGANKLEVSHASENEPSLYSLEDDAVLSAPFAIGAQDGTATPNALREFAKMALKVAPKSRIAVLVTSSAVRSSDDAQYLRDAQAFLPVTVVVIDIDTCLAMAQATEFPRDKLRVLMLEQTDLTKLSPFVVRGVTPPRVFFGREEEEATLISTLSTNSVALLGGRRIGKTSLMQHSFKRLASANLRPFFGDCQVVRTWADFGHMAARNWGCRVLESFRPHDLFALVDELRGSSEVPIVILLDEIDQLLDWDSSHSADEVPEAFFRACRSISQQGLAQFVFSGERTIALRIWDAGSPHWNFCRPLMLRQLSRAAAASLIIEPMEALGVRLEDAEGLADACWSVTDGHPELLQFLGDKIVAHVNRRDRTDVFASQSDVQEITSNFEYAEQYLETYWGQATSLERVISILLVAGPQTVHGLQLRVTEVMPSSPLALPVQDALRMLELYGIAEQSENGYQLRSLWFTSALKFYGGSDAVLARYIANLQT